MGPALSAGEETLLERALSTARDTRFLVVEGGARHDAARVFASAFGDQPALIVADEVFLSDSPPLGCGDHRDTAQVIARDRGLRIELPGTVGVVHDGSPCTRRPAIRR